MTRITCPKCGREGRIIFRRIDEKTYVYVRHTEDHIYPTYLLRARADILDMLKRELDESRNSLLSTVGEEQGLAGERELVYSFWGWEDRRVRALTRV